MKRLLMLFFLIVTASTMLLAGCAPTKQAIFLDAGFQPEVIDHITLLPVVDSRIGKKIKGNFDGSILANGMKFLKKNGYEVKLSYNIGEISQITADDLKYGDSEWIRKLGPSDAHYVMVVMLVDLRTRFSGLSSSGSAVVAGFLYNKDKGTMMWKDIGHGLATGGGGLIGLLAKRRLARQAIPSAMYSLVSTIPKRPISKDTKSVRASDESVQTEPEEDDLTIEKSSQEQTQLQEVSNDYGIITITSYPSGARVFIDGEFKGQTPTEISLATGTYQFFLQHQSYESYMDSVTIEKDQTQTLNIRLSPEGKEQR